MAKRRSKNKVKKNLLKRHSLYLIIISVIAIIAVAVLTVSFFQSTGLEEEALAGAARFQVAKKIIVSQEISPGGGIKTGTELPPLKIPESEKEPGEGVIVCPPKLKPVISEFFSSLWENIPEGFEVSGPSPTFSARQCASNAMGCYYSDGTSIVNFNVECVDLKPYKDDSCICDNPFKN